MSFGRRLYRDLIPISVNAPMDQKDVAVIVTVEMGLYALWLVLPVDAVYPSYNPAFK